MQALQASHLVYVPSFLADLGGVESVRSGGGLRERPLLLLHAELRSDGRVVHCHVDVAPRP